MSWIDFSPPPANAPFVVLDARINDVPARVVLDTGAVTRFALLVSPEFARRAGIAASDTPEVKGSGTVGPGKVGFRGGVARHVTLGPITLADAAVGITGAIAPLARQLGRPVDAIVGQRLLAGRTVAIDYVRHRIDLSAAPGDGPATPCRFAPRQPLTLVNVSINGIGPFVMVLDTGASSTLLSPDAARGARLTAARKIDITGAGGVAARGARQAVGRIVFGPILRRAAPIAVADVLGPVSDLAGTRIDGVLGADMLAGTTTRIDFGACRIWIDRAS